MTITLRFLTFLAILCAICTYSIAQENNGKVGDVRYSVLPPSQFERLNPGWVLMDGRPVNNTEYQRLTNQDSIPDGRAMFIRGANEGRNDVYKDIDNSTRGVGKPQASATGIPKNSPSNNLPVTINPRGSHKHRIFSDTPGSQRPLHGGEPPSYSGGPGPGDIKYEISGGSGQATLGETSNEPDHGHDESSIENRYFDTETRPSNITLYIYIKIDNPTTENEQ